MMTFELSFYHRIKSGYRRRTHTEMVKFENWGKLREHIKQLEEDGQYCMAHLVDDDNWVNILNQEF